MSNTTTTDRPTELVDECRLGYHDVCDGQDAAGTFCECECHAEEDSRMPMSVDEAILAEQRRRTYLREAARLAALHVVRTVTDGTWRVLAGDVVLGSLTRTTRETRNGRRRVVVEVTVVGDDWITRDVGIRGGVRFLAYSAALRAHGSAPCRDESLVDAIEASVRVEPLA